MQIFPAIDILDGKCVRLRQGRFEEPTVFSEDPVAMAKKWIEQGANYLHVVDLEGAKVGEPRILKELQEIVELGVPIETGGGMRTLTDIAAVLDAGAARVAIGTRIATDPTFAKQLFLVFGDKVAADIAAKDGVVAIHGWLDLNPEGKKSIELAKELEQLGASRIIFTDISRDGMLSGPNFVSIAQMVAAVTIPVIASGGVTCIEDICRLKQTGIEACIIGRALYSGEIKLPEAIAAAENK